MTGSHNRPAELPDFAMTPSTMVGNLGLIAYGCLGGRCGFSPDICWVQWSAPSVASRAAGQETALMARHRSARPSFVVERSRFSIGVPTVTRSRTFCRSPCARRCGVGWSKPRSIAAWSPANGSGADRATSRVHCTAGKLGQRSSGAVWRQLVVSCPCLGSVPLSVVPVLGWRRAAFQLPSSVSSGTIGGTTAPGPTCSGSLRTWPSWLALESRRPLSFLRDTDATFADVRRSLLGPVFVDHGPQPSMST